MTLRMCVVVGLWMRIFVYLCICGVVQLSSCLVT